MQHQPIERRSIPVILQTIADAQRRKEQSMPPSDDLALLLRELGLSDHARTTSPHEVFMGEILPAVRALTSAHERAPKQGEIQRRCWTLTIADGSPSQCQLFNGHEGEHRFYCHRDLKREQREADAARLRAAGCICAEIEADLDADEHLPDPPPHDARCPIALADALEGER